MIASDMQPDGSANIPVAEGDEPDRFRTITHVRREVFIIYREAKSKKRPVPEAYSLVQILQTGAKLMEQERDARIAELEAKVAVLEKMNAAQAQPVPPPQELREWVPPPSTAARLS
jgi:hypothetical protein